MNYANGGGVGARAQNGGTIVFDIDPIFGGSTIKEGINGGGGNTALIVNGASSQIIATGMTINLGSSGSNIGAEAMSGGTIALNAGTAITFAAGGGGNIGIWATGSGSQILTSDMTLSMPGGGGSDVGVRADTGASITLDGGSFSVQGNGGGEIGLLVQSAGTITAKEASVTVSGSGQDVGAKVLGGATLILDSATVSLPSNSFGESGLLVSGAGSTLSGAAITVTVPGSSGGRGIQVDTGGSATLSDDSTITTGGANTPGGTLTNGGSLAMSGGSVTTTGSGSFGFLSQGAANTLGLTDTVVSSAADSFAVQGGSSNITLSGVTAEGANGILLSASQGGNAVMSADASTLTGAITTAAGSASNVTLGTGTSWNMTGNSTVTNLVNNGSTINISPPTGNTTASASYKTLTAVTYGGSGGTIVLNTYLGTDNSPSDLLVVNGGSANGSTGLTIRNTTGPGATSFANGILVVSAINGATTSSTAFHLNDAVVEGPFEYLLMRGSVDASAPNSWFLRSDFTVTAPTPFAPLPIEVPPTAVTPPPTPPETTPPETTPPETIPPEAIPGEKPEPAFPEDPPPNPLPPGTYPIIGPDDATDSAVQPLARQLGLTQLGTLHERVGDALALADSGSDGDEWLPSIWGRVFGQQIQNEYRAFADTRVTGRLLGVQVGLDLWRGSLLPGHRDDGGFYFSYGNANADVDGLFSNGAGTDYVLGRAGTLNLNAYSFGLTWTHYGPDDDWYLDAVLQGTRYDGKAVADFPTLGLVTALPANGYGLISSLEGGYPIPLPLGPDFVLEPQGQIVWQQVGFNDANDGLQGVDLNTTSGMTGRLGARGHWTIMGDGGVVWQPYGRVNLWRDWGARVNTSFTDTNLDVPLQEQATRLELAGGLTVKQDDNLNFYAQGGYQFAVTTTDTRRDGLEGDFGLHYTW